MKRMKINIALTVIAVIVCGCAKVEDTLPDSYYLTDNITDTSLTEAMTSEPVTTTLPETTETLPVTTEITETMSETETETVPETVPLPDITVVTLPEPENTGTAEFVPGTLPPRETEASQTAPSITVVTIPTAPQTQESGQQESLPTDTAPAETYPAYYPENSYYALNFDRQQGMWISYLEFDRIMKNASKEDFTAAIDKCFDNMLTIGCNTVYFQVRVYGDAYYGSALFSKGDRLTGDYDPLAIAVRSAHDRGISIHAWVNPMRLMTDSQMKNIPVSYKLGEWYNDPEKNGTYLVNSNGRWYLNPAYPETVSLICDGISEIVSNYNVDGVQIDDYFYPTTAESFDSKAYEASGTSLSLADWRRDNVTKMVRRMYFSVHAANSSAVFGISPQGNTNNNYNDLYADIYEWCRSSDCCDYICPQIYFGFENENLPFTKTVDEWMEIVKGNKVKLVIGLAPYKTGTEDKYAGAGRREWLDNTDIIARQRKVTYDYNIGCAYFRYDSLFVPELAAAAYAQAELNNLKN